MNSRPSRKIILARWNKAGMRILIIANLHYFFFPVAGQLLKGRQSIFLQKQITRFLGFVSTYINGQLVRPQDIEQAPAIRMNLLSSAGDQFLISSPTIAILFPWQESRYRHSFSTPSIKLGMLSITAYLLQIVTTYPFPWQSLRQSLTISFLVGNAIILQLSIYYFFSPLQVATSSLQPIIEGGSFHLPDNKAFHNLSFGCKAFLLSISFQQLGVGVLTSSLSIDWGVPPAVNSYYLLNGSKQARGDSLLHLLRKIKPIGHSSL